MTVKELIEKLKQYDENMRVVVSGYEGGVDDVGKLHETGIKLNANDAWYYGKHEIVPIDESDEKAVYIE
jgi:hypothetical protein